MFCFCYSQSKHGINEKEIKEIRGKMPTTKWPAAKWPRGKVVTTKAVEKPAVKQACPAESFCSEENVDLSFPGPHMRDFVKISYF